MSKARSNSKYSTDCIIKFYVKFTDWLTMMNKDRFLKGCEQQTLFTFYGIDENGWLEID